MADFFFNHTFDVERRAIVDEFPDEIDEVKGQLFILVFIHLLSS